jgi:hypothetical protein
LVLMLAARPAVALERMPMELAVPVRATQRDTVPLTITPRGGSPGATLVDVYLVWAFRPDARFIAPDGTWKSEPIPVRHAVRLADLAPFTVYWRADPAGAISVALVAVEAGRSPIDRANWLWSPQLSWVTVHRPWALDRPATWMMSGLGLAAFACVGIVFAYARRARRQ